MKSIFSCILLSVLFLLPRLSLSAAPTLHQRQEIKVPLGFCWGDSPQKLEDVARSGGLIITQREENAPANKIIYTVHGVVGAALQENHFVFVKNSLIEIEYQYGNKKWDAKNYEEFFDAFRRMYDGKYGMGTQLIKREPSVDQNNITTSIAGYQWSQANAVLALYYYTAEQQEKNYRVVSLHYRAP